MAEQLRDGTGGSYLGKIDKNNRIYTRGVTNNETEEANDLGDAYNVNTGKITLTDAADTPVLYI